MAPDSPFDEWSTRWDPATPDDAEGLRRWQLARAWKIAEHLAESNPYYQARLQLGDERTEQAFRRIPATVKSDVVADCEAHPPFGSRTTVDRRLIRHIVETSGTSGRGREIYALDEADERAIFQAEAVGFWWAGVRPGTTVFLTQPLGVSAAGVWYLGALRSIGANVISSGFYPTERKVEILARYGADVVIASPSYLERLASACEKQGVDPAKLGVRSLLTSGEPYTVDWVNHIQERWGGATLHEQYGCTERILGWTCPGGVLKDGQLGVLHVPAELAYWEVINPETNEPAADGELGELISTPLQAGASPLLRFATRDRVRYAAAGSCPCGRPLPGIRAGRIERYDSMLKVKGVNVWPATFDEAVLSIPGVVTYRGFVTSSADHGEVIRIEVEPRTASEAAGLEAAVKQAVRARTGLNAEVTTLRAGEISESLVSGVKVVRWRDQRAMRT